MDEKWLDVYEDAGLRVLPIGEEATVDPTATLPETWRARPGKDFRALCRRIEKADIAFQIRGAERDSILSALRFVSDAWLTSSMGRKRIFAGILRRNLSAKFSGGHSLCAESPRGLLQSMARRRGIRRVEKVDIDRSMMRHSPEAPNDIMGYLFIRCMLWGKARGFRYFKLGMAPFVRHACRTFAMGKGGGYDLPSWRRFLQFSGAAPL